MPEYLHFDYETRSEIELGGNNSEGLDNYAKHHSTKALFCGWAFDDDEPQLWQPLREKIPGDLRDGFRDERIKLVAWNSSFERYISNNILCLDIGYELTPERFYDPQASARYLSLPGDLASVGEILGLPEELQKDKRGEDLIKRFSRMQKCKKKRGEIQLYEWQDWTTHEDEWQQFGDYCKQDVRAEREIMRRLIALQVFPLPPRERDIWIFDQNVNDRGMPTDVAWVKKAYALAAREKKEKIDQNNQLTGLANSNSNDKMLKWVRERGYEKNSLRKETVQSEIEFNDKLTPEAKEVLNIRKSASSTTYKKLAAIIRQVNQDDHRLRNQFLYMGSARCGRWSGNAVQLHNMARPNKTFEDVRNIDRLRLLVDQENYNAIKTEFQSVLTAVKYCVRTSFVAAPANLLRVCDLNAIETRVGAWVCGCNPLLNVFLSGKDPYLDFAVKIYPQLSYDTLAADLKSDDALKKAIAKERRQFAKPGVLGCVYRLSGGDLIQNKDGDWVKTGLWGYAAGYGVEMDRERAHSIVAIFRTAYKEIPEFWYLIERLVKEVLEGSRNETRQCGPGNIISIDKIFHPDRKLPVMRISLPSGRFLHYVDARWEEAEMPWDDETGHKARRKGLIYAGQNQQTKKWSNVNSHGGKLLENIVQGIARDVLAESLLKFENGGLPIVGHVHDEGISENPNTPDAPNVHAMEETMGLPIAWAPGLPLKAEGFESGYYRK